MLKKIIFLCVLWLYSFQPILASVIDSISIDARTSTKVLTTKSFKEFDDFLSKNHNQQKTNEFDDNYISQHFSIDSITNDQVSMAKAVMDELETLQNYTSLVSPDDLVKLPIGVKKEIGNITYILGISEALFTPEYTEVTAFVRIIIPQLDAQGNQKQLFFGGNNIKISHKGGIYGEANLMLLGDVPIPIKGGNAMLVLKGGFDMNTGEISDSTTYVTIDCSGFKELGISAEVVFPRGRLEPVNEDNQVIVDKNVKVKGFFKTIISDWNDILVEVSLPRFQIANGQNVNGSGKGGLIFDINTAVFDFSDSRNSPNIVFPDEYKQQYLISGNEQLWRGVYVNALKITLPKQFKNRENEQPVTFQSSHLLIDGMGVSGTFSIDNILPITKGDASKWQFSVDHLEASFLANNLTNAGFAGMIVLPLSGELTLEESKEEEILKRKALSYQALIDPINENYSLTITPPDLLSFDLFKAEAIITANSYVEMKVIENKFRPKAVLHGSLGIKGSNSKTNQKKATVDFKGITFQKLQLQTESPYFQVESMGHSGEVKLANFPITISEIGVIANDTEASLYFNVDINMMKQGFSGKTSLSIIGKFKEEKSLQQWKYDRIKFNGIQIEADLGSVQLTGLLNIKDDDPLYGDGFYGELGATFNSIKVDATAWFGKKDFRYWYVDAYADLSAITPKMYIGPSLIVNGFGGGASYRMSRASSSTTEENNEEAVPIQPSPSGANYIPDENIGLDFRAMVGFALANESAFNGKVSFEMNFNNSGGLNRILFFGEAHIIKPLDFKFGDAFKKKLAAMESKINSLGKNNAVMQSLKEANLVEYSKVAFPQDGFTFDVGIDAHFSMEMNFQNKSFDAQMQVFVNTPGGFFKGVGKKGLAGSAVLHASSTEWYLHIGTPTNRIGLKLGLGNFNVQATSYLMIGDNIPGSPPPPRAVAEILGVDIKELDSNRELNALGDGRGFAFGASLDINTGDLTFLAFYAKFKAGIGFDIMVKDYGKTECKGSGQIGIAGWYADGQAYAYLQGELGIRIKLLFVRKNIPIIKAGAAVLLQAKLPNPAWFRGYLGGYFDLLGGAVKGSFRFKIELGEECEIINGEPLGGLRIISQITPSKGAKKVDVFTVPQVTFNMKINHPFKFEDDKGIKTYRILLDDFNVSNKGLSIVGELEWNEQKDKVNFVSFDILPPNSSFKIDVSVTFQENRGGTWVDLQQDGKKAVQSEVSTFITGEAPNYIPLTNIVYCYPVIDQQYFYKNERNSGYVKLERGQEGLFSPYTDWTQVVQVESNSGIKTESNVSYNQSERTVNFKLPSLENKKDYTFRIVSFPPAQNNTNQNQEENYTVQNTGQEGTTIELRNKLAENVVQDDLGVDVLVYDFTTSAHNTFKEKIDAKKATDHYLEPIYSDVHAIQTDVQPSEKFGLEELLGSTSTNYKPMVEPEAILDDSYYLSKIFPLLYQGYPLSYTDHPNKTEFTVSRDVSVMGLPPKKAINMLTWYAYYLESNPSYGLLKKRIPYRYYLPYYYKHDFKDIQYKIVNAFLYNTSQYEIQIQKYKYIINGVFPSIWSGDYNVKMQYVLPGGIKGTNAIFTFNNPY